MIVLMSLFVHDSAVAPHPCPSGHITPDKKEIEDFRKFLCRFYLHDLMRHCKKIRKLLIYPQLSKQKL